jgi:hypothetical protein
VCRPVPNDCSSQDPDFACGCDGQFYDTPCHANAAGVDLSEYGCESYAELFPCGWKYCAALSQICLEFPNSEDFEETWGCYPTPDECIVPDSDAQPYYNCNCVERMLGVCPILDCTQEHVIVTVVCGQ